MPEDFDDDFEQISDQEVLDYSPSQPSKNFKVVNGGKTKDTAGGVVDTAGKGVKTAGNVTQAAGKGMQAAGKGAELAGKGAQTAGKGMQTAGKGIDKAGDAALNAGKALSGTGAGAVAGVPLAALGAVGKVAGKGTEIAGKGTEAAGKGTEKAGQKVQDAGKKINDAGKNLNNSGKKISDVGNRIKGSTKKNAKQPNVVDNTIDKAGKEIKKKTIKDILSKFDISKKIEESIDPMKKSLNSFKKWVKRSIIIVVLLVLFFPTIIYILFSPILEAMQWMNEKLDDAIEITQKGVNFYNGFGLQTTKEAFYEELDYLYEEYDHQIDIPLIMATLFYKEREGYDTSFNFDPEIDDGIEGLDVASQKEEIKNWLSEKYESVFSTLDEDGKNYTIGKIYRLRKLAKNQMDSQLFGTAAPSQEEEVTFSDFLERSKSRLSDDVYQALQGLAAENPIAALPQTISKIHELTQINDGNEIWATTSFGNESEAALGLQNLLKEVLITATEIKSIRYADGRFKVIIYKYNYSEDNFKNYLKKYYIRYMPEFKEDVGRLSDSAKEEAIDNIISEIYEYSDEYKEIFGYNENALSSDYDERCVGNIDSDLVKELGLPVKSSEFEFSGSDAYGISDGKSNNGVNLNENSAGVKEGDNVLAIADNGEVKKVVDNVECNTETDTTCDPKGNYIIIENKIKIDTDEHKIQSYYMNLKKGSIKVKEKDKVKKGDVIAQIGKTGDAPVAQLHFEIHDMNDGDTALNPTNLFIPCGGGGGGGSNGVDTLVGDSNKIKVWNYLLGSNYTKKAAAGIMGNWEVETTTFNPSAVEGCFKIYSDKDFVKAVESGRLTKKQFMKYPGNGCELVPGYANIQSYQIGQYGFGLAQWTSAGRKEKLYDFYKKSGKKIDDLKMQLDFYIKEANDGYPDVKNSSNSTINKSSSPEEAADIFRSKYEIGQGESNRRKAARKIYDELKNKNTNPKADSMDNLKKKENNDDNSTSSISQTRKELVNYAKSFVGHPYKYGGTKLCENWKSKSGCGVDCSGFVQGIFKKYGYNLGRTSDDQASDGKEIKASDLKPGDIVVYYGHVAIYIGNKKIVHASNPKDGVKISDNYDYRAIKAIRRIIKD